MLGSVFLMQPVGQALAQLVGLWVLLGREKEHGLQAMRCGIDSTYDTQCKQLIDGIWRIVIGSGAVPALLAIIFRFFLYDCGLYQLEVKHKPGVALRDTRRIYLTHEMNNGIMLGSPSTTHVRSPSAMPVQFSRDDLYNYFVRDGNWYYLLGTAMTWFM
jgi:MFS transporter, PHS family, inorganic phosphate transporter